MTQPSPLLNLTISSLLLGATFLPTASQAHTPLSAPGFTVAPFTEGEESVPVLQDQTEVASKINTHIQLDVLRLVIGQQESSIFERVRPGGGPHGLYCHGFKVEKNTQAVLSVTLDLESMGAYPSPFTKNLTFNAQTGEFIQVEDLFTSSGWTQTQAMLMTIWDATVEDHLQELEQEEDDDTVEMVRESYQQCREYTTFNRFRLTEDRITFAAGECLPHVIRALDISIEPTLSLQTLKPWLSPFGRAVLNSDLSALRNHVPQRTSNRWFAGTIGGQHAIKLMLETPWSDDGSLGGVYFYESQGKGLELSGRQVGSKLTLSETDPETGDVTGQFSGTLSADGFVGTWKSPTGRSLPVNLSPWQ